MYDIYRQQIQCLAGLPGQVSEFFQSEFGYEWRCEFELDGAQSLQLQFSLVDLDRQPRPAAVLYLAAQGDKGADRLTFPLENLGDTHECLNRELIRCGASIAALEKADQFVGALGEVRQELGDALTWA